MPEFVVPTNATLHAARSLLFAGQHAFDDSSGEAVLLFHPGWVHIEPIALSMIAAWGTWAKRQGYDLRAENLGKNTAYAARMRLFQQLGIEFDPGVKEHEEGRPFSPAGAKAAGSECGDREHLGDSSPAG